MRLVEYVQQFSLDDVFAIEHSDKQFLVLQQARNNIKSDNPTDKSLFVFLVMQCALVGFQIAGSGPLWRGEFAQKIQNDWGLLQQLQYNNTDRWYQFLTSSKYNNRLYNNKHTRLKKFAIAYNTIIANTMILSHYNDMTKLWQQLSIAMCQNPHNKTMAFTVKMYGYAARIVTNSFVIYPMDVVIPLDSRLHRIAVKQDIIYQKVDHRTIIDYYQSIAKYHQIPPLHLDSLIWINYWEKYM